MKLNFLKKYMGIKKNLRVVKDFLIMKSRSHKRRE